MSLDFLPATPWSLPLILFHTSERESNVQSEFSSPAGIQSSQHNFWALRGAAPSSEDVTLQSGGVALIKPSRSSYLRLKAARTHSFYCSSFGWTAQHMLTLIPAHGGSETSHQPPGQSHMYRESQSSRPIHHADSPDGGGRAAEVRGRVNTTWASPRVCLKSRTAAGFMQRNDSRFLHFYSRQNEMFVSYEHFYSECHIKSTIHVYDVTLIRHVWYECRPQTC